MKASSREYFTPCKGSQMTRINENARITWLPKHKKPIRIHLPQPQRQQPLTYRYEAADQRYVPIPLQLVTRTPTYTYISSNCVRQPPGGGNKGGAEHHGGNHNKDKPTLLLLGAGYYRAAGKARRREKVFASFLRAEPVAIG
jgi:hypothetical protein